VLTLAAFLLIGVLVVAACELTRGRFVRLLADQDPRTPVTGPVAHRQPGPRSDRPR
jgi:hypothetical protein